MSIWKRLESLEEFRGEFKRCATCGGFFHETTLATVSDYYAYNGSRMYCQTHKPAYDSISMDRKYWRKVITPERFIEVDENGKEIKS